MPATLHVSVVGRVFRVDLRRVGWWGFALLVGGYVAAASAVFWIWQRSPYSLLTYADALFYPARRAEIGAQQGRAFIAQGLELWRQKKLPEGAELLRRGLARWPRAAGARMRLAEYYRMLNRWPRARAVLVDGLTAAYPRRPYMEALVRAAEQAEAYDLVIGLAERYRPQLATAGGAVDRHWLEEREFAALLAAGRNAEALQLVEQCPPGDTARAQRALAWLALDRPGDAVVWLREWRRQPGADVPAALALEVRALREAGRTDEMESTLEIWRKRFATEPLPLAVAVLERSTLRGPEAARAALAEYLFRFGGSAENVQRVAELLAGRGEAGLVERCAAAAAERGFAAMPFQVLLVRANVQGGDWAAAARGLDHLAPFSGREASEGANWREWMQRLVAAAAAAGENAPWALMECLRRQAWSIQVYRTSVEALARAGQLGAARDVAELGVAVFPESAWLRDQATELAEAAAAWEAASAGDVRTR